MVDVGRDVFKLMKNDDFLVLMIQGQIFLKEGGKEGGGAGTFQGFFQGNFFKFIIFTCLHLQLTLPLAKLCYAFEEKSFFLPP